MVVSCRRRNIILPISKWLNSALEDERKFLRESRERNKLWLWTHLAMLALMLTLSISDGADGCFLAVILSMILLAFADSRDRESELCDQEDREDTFFMRHNLSIWVAYFTIGGLASFFV